VKLSPRAESALLALARTGTWTRRTKTGQPREIVHALVRLGLARKNDRRRYRITGRGLAYFDGEDA
jgi:hypothetical protein